MEGTKHKTSLPITDEVIAEVLGELYRVVGDHEVGLLDDFVLRSGLQWKCEDEDECGVELGCGYVNGRDDRTCEGCGAPRPARLLELMPEDVDWLQSDGHDVQALVERWVAAAYPEASGAEICEDLSIRATFSDKRHSLDVATFCEWLRSRGIR